MRPERPSGCPDAVFKLMGDCWKQKPADRLTFAKLKMGIQDAYAAEVVAQAGQDLHEQSLCVVCLEKQAEFALFPCGHKCVCEDHAAAITGSTQRGRGACPLCREHVLTYQRIY